ncbi:MAG: beta-lactamase family protein [Firmicutes bacterium]|nr:beta-lactamase family protein [Bacillota bacterium]
MDKKTMMENLVRKAHEKGLFTGTWLFAENGEIVSKGAVGWRDPANTLPMREDSLFDLASVSKNFCASAIMLLRRRGLLSLEDEVTRFFPEIPYKGVTIRHLLSHTGGLPDYMDWVEKTAENEHTIPSNAIIIRFLCECGEPAGFAPGEKYEYSNTGYCLLAQIVEKVSGVPFEEFVRKNIFEPAGMMSTRLIHRRKDQLDVENLAYGMILDNGKFILPDDSKSDSHCVVPLDGMNGDGIIHTNVLDLFQWDRALREGKVVTLEEQKLMYTRALLNNGEIARDEDDPDGYGFGWCISDDPELGLIVSHSGGWPGYSTWFERLIDADKVLVILKCRESLDGRGTHAFFEGMKAIVKGKEPEPIRLLEDIALKDPDKTGWEDLCGTYEWDKYRIEVFMKDGDLYNRFILGSWDSGEDRFYPLGEKKFGIKGDDEDITFGDGCLTFYGLTGKKV